MSSAYAHDDDDFFGLSLNFGSQRIMADPQSTMTLVQFTLSRHVSFMMSVLLLGTSIMMHTHIITTANMSMVTDTLMVTISIIVTTMKMKMMINSSFPQLFWPAKSKIHYKIEQAIVLFMNPAWLDRRT